MSESSVIAHMARDAYVWCIVPHVRFRTCELGVVFHVFTRVGDTSEVFVSAVARVCVRYSDVLHVCTYTMLDSTTRACAMFIISAHVMCSGPRLGHDSIQKKSM